MRDQRVAIHQQGIRGRQPGTQLIEDREAMRVDIAPIEDASLMQPGNPSEHIPAIPGAEHDDGSPARRKRKKVDLVLGDEYPLDAEAVDRQVA